MLHRVAPMLLLLASSAMAAPVPKDAIPEDTRWIIHVDIDAARGTALWNVVAERFVKPRLAEIAPQLQGLERLTGASDPAMLHDLTLFGTSFDETTVCILVHAAVDQNRILTYLKKDPEFNTQEHNGHTVYTWRDQRQDRPMYGCFTANDIIILAPAPKLVFLTLDTLDSKSPALKDSSPLLPQPTVADAFTAMAPLPLLWIASINLSDLAQVQKVAPVLLHMSTGSIAISSDEEKIFVHVFIATNAENVAKDLASVAEGFKSMVFLQNNEHARPLVREGADLLHNLNILTEGKNLIADLPISSTQLDSLAQLIFPAESAAGEPHTAAVPEVPH